MVSSHDTDPLTLMASEVFTTVKYTCKYYVMSPPGLASNTATAWCRQVERSADGWRTTRLAYKAGFQMLLELSMVMRAKRKCKRDDSDSECNDIDSNSDGCDEKREGGG